MRMTSIIRVAVLGCLLPCTSMLVAQQPRSRPAEKRMEAVQRLKLAQLPGGTLPTFYSTGAEARARYFQALIAGERDFYRQQLHVPLGDLHLAVLSPEQWSPVTTRDPYGMPSVQGHPRVITMPADWSKAVIISVPEVNSLSPQLQQEVSATGKPIRDLVYVGADSIGTHELGHAIIEDYGIGWTTYWFNEFLASYVGNVYIEEKRPADRAADHIMWQVALGWPHPHTSLDYFETHYDELSERAPQLTSAQVLDKLESITPGWKQWAAEVEADRVTVVRD